MAVTIQQIAEAAGVSRGTVDRALHNRGRIHPEVSERIRKIADELGYIPKKHKGTQKKGGWKIGIVTQLARSPFMLEVSRGIEEAARELKMRGVEVIVEEGISVDEYEQLSAIEKLEKKGIDALALMPVDREGIRLKMNELVEKGIPVVTFNSDIVGTGRSCFVGMNNRKSGQAAAGLLGMLTRGKGKVLVITGFFSSHVNNTRVDGFVDELKKSYPGLELAGVQGCFDEADEVERIIENTMAVIPELNGILVVSGGQQGISRAFWKLKLEKRPYVIIYDQTTDNEKALQENHVDFLIDQDGFVQGYRPPCILADILQGNVRPEKELQYTDINIKTKYNL